jgi:hypothetical protein
MKARMIHDSVLLFLISSSYVILFLSEGTAWANAQRGSRGARSRAPSACPARPPRAAQRRCRAPPGGVLGKLTQFLLGKE